MDIDEDEEMEDNNQFAAVRNVRKKVEFLD